MTKQTAADEISERIVEAGQGLRYQFGETLSGRPVLTVWRGARAKPICNGIIRDRAHGLAVVNKLVAEEREKSTEREARRIAGKSEQIRQRALYEVGTIVCNSWGWEQTNVDYYEVVSKSKSGSTVTLRAIGFYDRSTPEDREQMTGKRSPKPGQFFGPPITKRITKHGVQFGSGWAKICKATDTHRTSHYG